MKRLISSVLILSCLCLMPSTTLAEEESKPNLFESIGTFFSNTWNDVSSWTGDRWSDFTTWVSGAWGDASKWVTQAWSDSSAWVTDIWGDASNWVVESYESASGTISAWWAETFNQVTDTNENAWTWLRESASVMDAQNRSLLYQIRDVLCSSEGTDEKSKEVFYALLTHLGASGSDADKVWETIQAYSEQKGISTMSAVQISLPYLLQLKIDSEAEANSSIPAVAVAQYLTAIIEKMGISSESIATDYVDQLLVVLQEM